MPLKMPITTHTKNKATPNGSEKLSEHEFICCGQFNFKLRDVDAFLFKEATGIIPSHTIVNFKGYSLAVLDQEKILYNFLSKELTPLTIE
jgi:hypothetical protein